MKVVIIADCAAPLDRLAALLDAARGDAIASPGSAGARSTASAVPSVIVQLRDKRATGAALYDRARAIVALGATLLVNDRLDVALAAGAAGVHLPEDGLDVATARALGAKLVGCSRHTPEAAAACGADLVILGPIFATPSKPGVAPLGVEALRSARALMKSGVLCAIGGIESPARAAEAREAGADAVAGIRAFWGDLETALAIVAVGHA